MRDRPDGLVDHDDADAGDEEEGVGHREAEAADRHEVLGLPEAAAGGGHRPGVCNAERDERLLVIEYGVKYPFTHYGLLKRSVTNTLLIYSFNSSYLRCAIVEESI